MCGGAGGGADAAQLAAFSRAALHECMTREEPGALPAYVETHADVAAFLRRRGGTRAARRRPRRRATLRRARGRASSRRARVTNVGG